MSDQDDVRIAAALDALSQIRTPHGMEQRVLDSVLMQRVVSTEVKPDRSWARARRGVAWSGAVAVVAMAVGTVGLFREAGPARDQKAPAAARIDSSQQSISSVTAGVVVHPALNPTPAARATAPGRVQRSESGKGHQSRATDRGWSYPAPPVPLTREERALIAIAQASSQPGRAADFAMLNPVERDRQDAAKKVEFERFVAQSN